MGALVAFPAASIDPGDARQTQLALVDLEGLVFHHAPSSHSRLQSAIITLKAKTLPEDKRQGGQLVTRTSESESSSVCRVKILAVGDIHRHPKGFDSAALQVFPFQ